MYEHRATKTPNSFNYTLHWSNDNIPNNFQVKLVSFSSIPKFKEELWHKL